MATCEICGKVATLVKAIVSGTELEVCEPCSKYGRVVKKMGAPNFANHTGRIGSANQLYSRPVQKLEESPLAIVPDYAHKVKRARENMKITHDELSRKIGLKESLLHHIESGHHEPSIPDAEKLEKFFSISLIEKIDDKKSAEASSDLTKKKASEGMTLGDFIKKKR